MQAVVHDLSPGSSGHTKEDGVQMLDIERVRQAIEGQASAPIHIRLRQAIYSQILDGTLKVGEKLPSERELQERLGLSRGTIRQALTALNQAGLTKSFPGAGTFVLETSKDNHRAGTIGLVVSSTNFHFFYPQLAASFNHVIRQAGYSMAMHMHNDQAEELLNIIEDLKKQDLVGLALTPPRFGRKEEVVRELVRMDIPVVSLGRREPWIGGDSVAPDNEMIGYVSTRHLIDLGHENIVHMGLLDYSTGRDRAEGYRKAMEEAGLPPHIVPLPPLSIPATSDGIPDEHLAAPAYEKAMEIWNGGGSDKPTAVFCFNDIMAMGVYKALREIGLKIPEDVSVVGVDNLPTVRHMDVPLTTSALPGNEIGRVGAETLLKRIAGDRSEPHTLLIQAKFIERASTARLQ